MDLLASLPLPLRLAPFLVLGLFSAADAGAQTDITDDYIYIGIEAEDHVVKNERWVLTDPSTPTEENDPDGNHSDGASGSTYLELLPDMRVTHDDTFGPPTAYWGQGGQGPDADYLVTFPEPGRYYVHVRAYSTGTEDNGLHLGINGTWPASGQRMQFCTASRRAWWWSSAQRDAGGNGSCGIEKSIWLDVPSAGEHTVSISAREDGFEIDRLALLKDLSGNTKICEPTNISDVNCRAGSIESADGFVDLRVRLETEVQGADPEEDVPNPLEVDLGNNVILTARIENLDAFDTANDIVLTLSPATVDDWTMIDMDSRCSVEEDVYNCTLDDLHPTAPNENAPFVFTLQADAVGDLRIDASLLSAEVDETPDNDVAATIIKVLGEAPPEITETDIQLSFSTDKDYYETGEIVRLSARLSNLGSIDANEVAFGLGIPAGLSINAVSLPEGCMAVGDQLQCNYAIIESERSELLYMEFLSDQAGIYTLSGSVDFADDSNQTNNFDSDTLLVTDPEVETTTSGSNDTAADANSDEGTTGTDAGTDTSGSTDSGTINGGTAGLTDGAATDGETTGTASAGDDASGNESNSGSGALTHWLVLLLILFYACRLYSTGLDRRHQRQRVSINQ